MRAESRRQVGRPIYGHQCDFHHGFVGMVVGLVLANPNAWGWSRTIRVTLEPWAASLPALLAASSSGVAVPGI
ncbi:MAG: hypothetical protein FJX65_19025 [Alphaproteobacteria bacterium]|nr:hypothetical protein [Alphaproteobacteria bacterium]